MDRAARLANEAKFLASLEVGESEWFTKEAARNATRECLADYAEGLGFSSLEISSAVDQALKDAGVGT